MIRQLHISCPTNIDHNWYLYDFIWDVYFNHLPSRYHVDMDSRQGIEVVVDDAAVVSLLLSKAGFSVLDLGKVSV